MNIPSPFIFDNPVIPPIFAGRKDELAIINHALFIEHQSMAVFGHDAIGKSSLLETIHQYLDTKTKVLSISIDAMALRIAIEGNFLGLITKEICIKIWTKALERKFTDLLGDTLMYVREDSESDADADVVKRIYKFVTNTKFVGTGKVSTDLSGKFVVGASRGEEKSMNYSRDSLSSSEFLSLIDELNDVVKSLGFDSIIIVCDEMNHLPNKINSAILRDNLVAFSSKKIRFLLTLANPDWFYKEDFDLLVQAFNSPFEISHFKDHTMVKELISNIMSTVKDRQVNFSANSFKTLFEITKGHPWWIQKIANDAYFEALGNRRGTVNSRTIEKNCEKYLREMQIYNEKMAAGLPFRKNDLFINR